MRRLHVLGPPRAGCLAIACVLALFSSACASVRPAQPGRPIGSGEVEVGIASFYADSLAGHRTASGQPYDPRKATCAHRTLRFDTEVEVRLKKNGNRATCRVNDRGPWVSGRIIDLSRAVAKKLGVAPNDLYPVEIRVLDERSSAKRERAAK